MLRKPAIRNTGWSQIEGDWKDAMKLATMKAKSKGGRRSDAMRLVVSIGLTALLFGCASNPKLVTQLPKVCPIHGTKLTETATAALFPDGACVVRPANYCYQCRKDYP